MCDQSPKILLKYGLLLLQSLNCRPIASLDHFVPEALGSAELVEEIHTGPSKIVKVGVLLIYVKFTFQQNPLY